MFGGPASISARVTRSASQSYTGSSGPKQRSQTPTAPGSYSASPTRQRITETGISHL